MVMGKLLLFIIVMVLVGVCGDSGEDKPCPDPDDPNNLQCSNTPIEGKAGDRVILPCSRKDKMDISHDTVEWFFKDSTTHVHTYLSGEDYLQKQSDDFKDRTSLFKDQLSSGNCSLSLNVTTSHNGTYHSCVGEQLYCTVTLIVLPAGGDNSSQREVTVSPDKPNKGTDGPTTTQTVGLGVGIPAALLLLVIILACCYHRLRQRQKKPLDQNPTEEQTPMKDQGH